MAPAVWQAIGILRMEPGELTRFALTQAEENPFLSVRPGQGRGRAAEQAGSAVEHPEGTIAHRETLHEAVSRQIEQIEWSVPDRRLAYRYLEALEPWGWVSSSADEIAENARVAQHAAERVLARLQRLEPPGIFARGLAECLSLQLADRGLLGEAEMAVLAALQSGGPVAPDELADACRLSRDRVVEILGVLRTLDPKPGLAYASTAPVEVTPDVIVCRGETGWQVELNASELPAVSVDQAMMTRTVRERPGKELGELRKAYGTARWLVEAIRRRNETILAIAGELVRRQVGFVEEGPGRLCPLSQREVAQALGLSDSSVSRVVRTSWAQLPRGVVCLKSFFATSLPLKGQDASVSAPMVREMIVRKIREEDALRPLSDQELADWLALEGISVTRRTVANYRAAMGLPGCRVRRQMGRPDTRAGTASR